MTKLFMKMSFSHKLRDPANEITLMMDSQTKEILQYQSFISENKKTHKEIVLNEEHMPFTKSYAAPAQKENEQKKANEVRVNNVFPNSTSIEVRQDLIDCEIAICTLDVLQHFEDNFDKTVLKDGFINWLYGSDIIEDRVRAYLVEDQGAYFARIHNPRLYGVVS